ncbi:MAG: response regulator, partial [Bdellovibrionia bacterium]
MKDYKILIVDDYDYDRFIISSYLTTEKEIKYRILEAESVKRAIEILNSTQVDCLVTDYNLIGGSGLLLMDKIKAEYPNIVGVMMSGTNDAKSLKLFA